jgi:hypothetical protein
VVVVVVVWHSPRTCQRLGSRCNWPHHIYHNQAHRPNPSSIHPFPHPFPISQFLRDMGGLGQAPEGSIAGRRKAMDAKFARDEGPGEASADEEEPADYDALAARIADSGGTIVEDARALKKTRRSGDDKAPPAETPGGGKPAAGAAPAEDEELLQVDEGGRTKVKFVAVDPGKVAERRAKAGAGAGGRGGPAVRNATLLSFGGDGDDDD